MAARPKRSGVSTWVVGSLALHALLWLTPQARGRVDRVAELPANVWMEAQRSAPEPEPEPEVDPAPPPRHVRPPRPTAARRAPSSTAPDAAASPMPVEPLASSDGFEGVPDATAVGAGVASVSAPGAVAGANASEDATGSSRVEPARVAGAPQLSLWLSPGRLEALVLTRPVTALLMSLPGYSDVLRGSGVRPFHHLERLRIRLGAGGIAGIAVAGVHAGGEDAMRAAAAHVAAMRNLEPVWRDGSGFVATSWADGSGVDRGLALHGGSFLIGARAALPTLLGGDDPSRGLARTSHMRERVAFALFVEDVARYLPDLSGCALQALRVSVADGRIALDAHYPTPSDAARSQACARELPRGGALSVVVGWLARARTAADTHTTRLRAAVPHDEVVRFLEGLAYALRRTGDERVAR